MWVLIDNYDSFTHILHHYLLQTGNECKVYRNDEITVEELKQINPDRIIISPGPETPLQSGICMDVINYFHATKPILGICLGHQALGMFYGCELMHAAYPMHGKVSMISHQNHSIFNGIPTPFEAMRYHSLAIACGANSDVKILATSCDDHLVMAIAHKHFPSIGIQFHPESIGTNSGMNILKNWSQMYR